MKPPPVNGLDRTSARRGPPRRTTPAQSSGNRKVRVTHQWVERSVSRPPSAPEAAVYPPTDGEANGTDLTFQWTAACDPDGDAIADYHFELSSRPDLRWPLSMSFYKLISRTADATKEKSKDGSADKVIVKPQYTLAQAGLLTPDRRYYFDIEKPRFTLERGPAWLKNDQNTGVLSGTPDATGRADVVVAIRLEREVRQLDEPVLAWGNEKVLSTSIECVGAATQDFTITVK